MRRLHRIIYNVYIYNGFNLFELLFALQFHVDLSILNILKGLHVARFVRFVLAITYLTLPLHVNANFQINSLTYLKTYV